MAYGFALPIVSPAEQGKHEFRRLNLSKIVIVGVIYAHIIAKYVYVLGSMVHDVCRGGLSYLLESGLDSFDVLDSCVHYC